MKQLLRCLIRFGLLFGSLGLAGMFLPLGVSIASTTTYDLAADWSDAANPNGVWTYREGTNALPSVPNWTPLSSPVTQPAWAPSATGGNFLPAWFKSRSNNPEGMDFLIGDVVVHSTDSFNGSANGVANVIWTSPINGVIDISGGVWMTRDIARSNTWTLLFNGSSLTSGSIFSGDLFNRASPFDFANGSGGSPALNNIAVSIGDVIELRIEKTSTFGDFVAVNLTITADATEDSDGDGISDNEDNCPNSDLSATVVIDSCDSGVPNTLFPIGCTISDLIAECAKGASTHGQFVSCVSHVTKDLKKAGTITGQQKGAIQSCAAKAHIRRGRDAGYPAPPAQIPACGITAPGSCLR